MENNNYRVSNEYDSLKTSNNRMTFKDVYYNRQGITCTNSITNFNFTNSYNTLDFKMLHEHVVLRHQNNKIISIPLRDNILTFSVLWMLLTLQYQKVMTLKGPYINLIVFTTTKRPMTKSWPQSTESVQEVIFLSKTWYWSPGQYCEITIVVCRVITKLPNW